MLLLVSLHFLQFPLVPSHSRPVTGLNQTILNLRVYEAECSGGL